MLFYLDPPHFNCEDGYGKGMFGQSDLRRLAKALAGLKGRFLRSLYGVPVVREISPLSSPGGSRRAIPSAVPIAVAMGEVIISDGAGGRGWRTAASPVLIPGPKASAGELYNGAHVGLMPESGLGNASSCPISDCRGATVLRVLIVEDEPLIALMAEELLTEAGHVVVGVARSKSGAETLAAETYPDLALVDFRLTDGRSGARAAIALRQTYGVPTLFVSADANECRKLAREAMPLGCLQKPHFGDELVRTVAAAEAMLHGRKPGAIPRSLELY